MQYAHDAAGTPTPAAADRRRAPQTHEAKGEGLPDFVRYDGALVVLVDGSFFDAVHEAARAQSTVASALGGAFHVAVVHGDGQVVSRTPCTSHPLLEYTTCVSWLGA